MPRRPTVSLVSSFSYAYRSQFHIHSRPRQMIVFYTHESYSWDRNSFLFLLLTLKYGFSSSFLLSCMKCPSYCKNSCLCTPMPCPLVSEKLHCFGGLLLSLFPYFLLVIPVAFKDLSQQRLIFKNPTLIHQSSLRLFHLLTELLCSQTFRENCPDSMTLNLTTYFPFGAIQ